MAIPFSENIIESCEKRSNEIIMQQMNDFSNDNGREMIFPFVMYHIFSI